MEDKYTISVELIENKYNGHDFMFFENQQNVTNNGKLSYPFVFVLNIWSLRYLFDELMLKIQDYDLLRPSLIFVTDYLLTENDPPSEYVLEGYQQLKSKLEQNGTRSGVAFDDLSGVEYEIVRIIECSNELEYLKIKATFDKANFKNFGDVHRPDGLKLNVFFDFFEYFVLF